MDSQELARKLAEYLQDAAYLDEDDLSYDPDIEQMTFTDYNQADILTSDAGFIIDMKDGSQFQVTIVQSKGSYR